MASVSWHGHAAHGLGHRHGRHASAQHRIRGGSSGCSGGGGGGWSIRRIRHPNAIGGRLQDGSGESGIRVDGGVRPGDGDALALVLHAAILEPHLDGALGQVELGGQLAAPGSGDIVLLVELLLEAGQLVAGEGSAVATHRGIGGNL